MKKILLGLFLLPLLGGLSVKNASKTSVFYSEKPTISRSFSSQSEAFIEYWENDFREHNPAVCDITYEAYKEMYNRYLSLSESDRAIVNSTVDTREPDYTIGQIIKTLVNRFYPNNQKMQNEKSKLDQSTIIVIATVIALVGATAISILYILKNKKVIE